MAILDSGLHRPANERDPSQRADIRRNRNRLKEYKGLSATDNWTDHGRSNNGTKNMHGTNCASLLLQVAPEADLYVANVVDTDGHPTADLVSAALKWALEDGRNIDIITMSLGLNSFNHRISDLIDSARMKKVLVFASSSNDGDYAQGTFPAMLPTVFDIKSTTGVGIQATSNPRLTDEKANFMFLGQDISIAGLRGSDRLSGNSYATPIAAGTAALVLDLSVIVAKSIAAKVEQTHDVGGAANISGTSEGAGTNSAHDVEPRVDKLLRKYEGMSAVFKAMSGKHEPGRFHYNVHPWNVLRKYYRPPQPGRPAEATEEWYTYVRVCEELDELHNLGQNGDFH